MRFNKIKMLGFKKYADSTIEFGSGLNLFHGPNEAGKSTLHQAIITALYGLNRRSDTNLLRTREEARSWKNPSDCSIELEYTVDDGHFSIRRDIDSGKVELYSVDENDRRVLISANKEEVEAIITDQTGIQDPYVFNKTVSICQTDIAETADLNRIGSNIEAVFAGQNALTAADAVEFLDKNIRKPLRKVKNESPGRLDQLTERLETLIHDIEKAKEEDRRREQIAQRIDMLEHRLPMKKTRLQELTDLIKKAEAKAKVEDNLENNRSRFNSLQERIRNIDECTRKLEELQETFDDFGTITLFDPDQLDTARIELEKERSELEAQAANLSDRIQAMQKRMKSAEELSSEIALIEQQIGEYGKLSSEDDLDALDAHRRELAEKFRAADEHVREQNDKLEHLEHSLWGLEQFIDKYPDLGDAWELQSQWQRLYLKKDEHKRALEHCRKALADHEEHRPPPTFGNLLKELPLPLAFIGLLIASLFVFQANPIAGIPLMAITAGVATWYVVWKTKRRSRREQWRNDHKRLQAEASEAEALWREICDSIREFTSHIGVNEDNVSSFIEEYRSNQDDLRSLRREHDQCVRDRDHAVAMRDETEKESRRLAETYGCIGLPELRDRITTLRELRGKTAQLSERLAGTLGLEKLGNPEEMMLSAREILAELHDQKKRIEKKQMDLAHKETALLQRTACDDILQLGERTKRLRSLLATRDKVNATLEAHSAGKSIDELKNEQNNLTLEIKVAMAKLEEDFAGFDATAEQTEFWRKERDRLENEIPTLSNELAASRAELNFLHEHASVSVAELEGEKEYIESEIEHGDFLVTACKLACDVLQEVQTEHHDEYVPKLQAESGKSFERLTDGAYRSVDLLEKWPKGLMAVDTTGRLIEAEKLSRGTIDQLYFSLRLALGNALSGVTILPLILDDPFVNFDQGRLNQALETVVNVVEEGRQVLYFTHQSPLAEREEEWKRHGISVQCVQLGSKK